MRAKLMQCAAQPRGDGHPANTLFIIGDSHASATLPGVASAVEGRMNIGMLAHGGFTLIPCQKCKDDPEINAYRQSILAALRQHVRRGDVVITMSASWQSPGGDQWLQTNILEPILRPAGASLVMVSDNPQLSSPPTFCSRDLSRCHVLGWGTDTRRGSPKREAQMAAFARSHPDVYVFQQSKLWENSAAVPGTQTNAYFDDAHLNIEGALYLAPYFCNAFKGWGFFGEAQAHNASKVWSYPGLGG